jgi:hypothetical protein
MVIRTLAPKQRANLIYFPNLPQTSLFVLQLKLIWHGSCYLERNNLDKNLAYLFLIS